MNGLLLPPLALLLALAACHPRPVPALAKKSHPAPAQAPSEFGVRHKGWTDLDANARHQIMAHAERYSAFLASAKTPRRAASALAREAVAAGAVELPMGLLPPPPPGARYLLRHPGGDALAVIVIGSRPLDEGLRGVVADLDAPRLSVKQSPVFDQAGLTLLDTLPVGNVDAKQWLAYPLALYMYSARPGAAAGAIDVSVGDQPGDPILAIPDLLPHLSYGVQAQTIVDDPERLNALAALDRGAVLAFLAAQGMDEADLGAAELSLVPAGAPHFVGPDRGLVAGYGHAHRALAYDAVRAVLDDGVPTYTSVVIAVSTLQSGGATGLAFVPTVLGRVVSALAGEVDHLTVLKVYARSALLVGLATGGKLNGGLAVNPRASDALPAILRLFLDATPKVRLQIQDDSPSEASPARQLGTLGLGALDVWVPASGRGSPLEVISTLDLYQGYLACQGWFGKTPTENP